MRLGELASDGQAEADAVGAPRPGKGLEQPLLDTPRQARTVVGDTDDADARLAGQADPNPAQGAAAVLGVENMVAKLLQ